MADKKCPRCGLWNTGSASRCDCGYDFESGLPLISETIAVEPTHPSNSPTPNERFWALASNLSFFLVFILLFTTIFLDNPRIPIMGSLIWIMLFVSFFFGPALCLLIYSKHKKHSQYVASHSIQALFFQLVYNTVLVLISLLLPKDSNEAGFFCVFPFICIPPLFPLFGGILSLQGKDFDYPIIKSWVGNYLSK